MDGDRPNGFLSRWARRKEQVQSGVAVLPEAPTAVVSPMPVSMPLPDAPAAAPAPSTIEVDAPPLPTLQDVALLTRESDYSRFVAPGVGNDVRNAAMKKLFTDPHFNLMDGLDTYIDDYGKPDPLPLAMLRQMNQAKFLGLFDDEDEAAEAQRRIATDTAPNAPEAESESDPEPELPADDHPDLQLQQDHAAGRPGPDQGAGA